MRRRSIDFFRDMQGRVLTPILANSPESHSLSNSSGLALALFSRVSAANRLAIKTLKYFVKYFELRSVIN